MDRWRAHVASMLALLVLALAPLPLGSDAALWWTIWLLPLLACIALVGFPLGEGLRDLKPVLLLAVTVAAALVAQGALGSGWLAADRLPFSLGLDPAGQAPAFQGFGTTRHANAAWCLGAVLAAVLAGYALGEDRNAALRLVSVHALVGCVLAGVAIAQYLAAPDLVFWYVKTAHKDVLTTPFLNRNVACAFYGYAGIGAAMLALRAALPAPHAMGAARLRPSRLILAGWAAGAILCIAAALLTGSRAGIATVLLGLVAAAVIYRSRESWRLFSSAGLLIGLLGLGLLLVVLFADTLGARIAARGVGDVDRWTTYESAVAMVRDHPWLGVGAWNFADAFPPYRLETASPVGTWERAHSLPLQVAVEFGLPAAVVLVLVWLVIGGRFWHLSRVSRDNPVIAIAGGIWLAAGLHALVDYPMQIAGLVLPTLLIIGCALRRRAIARH